MKIFLKLFSWLIYHLFWQKFWHFEILFLLLNFGYFLNWVYTSFFLGFDCILRWSRKIKIGFLYLPLRINKLHFFYRFWNGLDFRVAKHTCRFAFYRYFPGWFFPGIFCIFSAFFNFWTIPWRPSLAFTDFCWLWFPIWLLIWVYFKCYLQNQVRI